MRVVFDTNVIIAGIVAQGLCREILEGHVPRLDPLLSDFLWAELVDKLATKFGLREPGLPILGRYRKLATWVEPAPLETPICRDPDDDHVLAAARAGNAKLIVTGDQDLLILRSFGPSGRRES